MSQPGIPPATGERWNVNMPAVIGVVFVFLVGVVVWVIAGGGDDEGAIETTSSTTTTLPIATTTTSTPVPPTATPTPLPDPSAVSTTATAPPATVAATAPPPPPATAPPAPRPTTPPTRPPTTPPPAPPPPPTTAAGADPDAVPGDLGIADTPMSRPPCDGSFITIVASAIGGQATADGIATVLATYQGSAYLRTDQTCPSLNQDVGGEPIYVVYLGPFAAAADACAARVRGPADAYARVLSDDPASPGANCP